MVQCICQEMSLTKYKKDSTHAIKTLWHLNGKEINVCLDFVLEVEI